MRRNRKQLISLDKDSILLHKESVLSDENFLDELCNKLTYEEVLNAIENLDDKYEDVLYMYFALDLPVSEIAKTLDRKLTTVKKQLERGKAMLIESVKYTEVY